MRWLNVWNNSVPYYPEEDAKLRATSLSVRRGGNSSNSLEVMQQLVAHPSSPSPANYALHLVTSLPSRQSADTARIVSSFSSLNDDDDDDGGATAPPATQVHNILDYCVYREDQTQANSCYIIRSQATGSRTIVNHGGLADLTTTEFVDVVNRFRYQLDDDDDDDDKSNSNDAAAWWHFEVRVPVVT